MSKTIDLTDVPVVSARELGVAIQLLRMSGGMNYLQGGVAEHALRQAELSFWQRVERDPVRKSAVLVRMRAFVEVCGTRRIKAVVAEYGNAGLALVLDAAASQRLNAERGLNPLRLSWAVTRGLDPSAVVSYQAAA